MPQPLTPADALFLGLDSSTQGMKATVTDVRMNVAFERAVNFDRDLPAYRTEGGVHRHPDGLTITSPPLMWVEALDLLLAQMKESGVPFDRVVAVSGSGQQHGSVWLNGTARSALRGLDPCRSLREQLGGIFSVAESPIWMDASTQAQCKEREAALGGAQACADLTGSRAFERFTGNQIAKIRHTRPEQYASTERIALVSSFVASLLVGDFVPIDTSDGAGMNLMDLRAKTWAPAALNCTAPDLEARLGALAPGHAPAGRIHAYYAARYGFPAGCLVVMFSGDNPNSLAGLRLQRPGDLAISLGTSDTLFASVTDPKPSATEGHVFANPVDPDAYMVMIVRKNGSLTRERIRDRAAAGSWEAFGSAMARTPPGNDGRIGFYVDVPEITPPLDRTGAFRFGPDGMAVKRFNPDVEVRAVIESTFLALRFHGENVGLRPASILATGGASANMAILRVAADVFGAPVSVAEKSDSASLGAAYRAMHGWTCAQRGQFVPFAEVMDGAPPFRLAVRPDPGSHRIYTDQLHRYASLESRLLRGQ